MQPQGPANPQGGPYNPYGPQPGQPPRPGQPPYQPGNAYPGAQPYPQAAPGMPTPALPGQPAMPHPGMPQPGQPGQQLRPGMPQYQAPQGANPANPDIPPPPEAASTPYDFFMQPKPAQPLNPLPVSGKHLGNIPVDYNKLGQNNTTGLDALKAKLPLIAIGGVVLVLVLFAISALMPKDETGPQLFSIAQTQQEINRVCAQGASKARYRSTRYFAVTCSTAVYTNQKDLLDYMSKQHLAFSTKQLGNKASGTTDSKLKSALSSSSYDATFREIVGDQLDSYDKALTGQLGITTGANAREVLTKAQTSNQLLIKMVHDDSDKTEAPADTGS